MKRESAFWLTLFVGDESSAGDVDGSVLRRCGRGARRWEAKNGSVQAFRRATVPFDEAVLSENRDRETWSTARAVGSIAAGAGLGLFAYALAAETAGPIGWAAALVFFGGLAAYAAHRRLGGH